MKRRKINDCQTEMSWTNDEFTFSSTFQKKRDFIFEMNKKFEDEKSSTEKKNEIDDH